MAKSNTYQRFVLRIHSKRLRENKWNLSLTLKEARENDEIISLAYSRTLKMIDEICKNEDNAKKIKEIKKQIKKIQKEETEKKKKKQIRKLYSELDKLQYVKQYVNVIMDKEYDYRKSY